MSDNHRRGTDRQHRRPARRRTVLLRLDDTEYDALVDAAANAGLTPSGFAAEAVVAVTQRTVSPNVDPARLLLQELMHIRTQIRRHNCDVRQALSQPTAGGNAPDRLAESLKLSNHAVTRIDDSMDQLGRLLRKGRTALPNQ